MIQRLEMQNVSKRYPGVMALKGINMMVGPGEIVALLGEMGIVLSVSRQTDMV